MNKKVVVGLVVALLLVTMQAVSGEVIFSEDFEGYVNTTQMEANWTETVANIDLETGFGHASSKCMKTWNATGDAEGTRTQTRADNVKVTLWVNTTGDTDSAAIYMRDNNVIYAYIAFGHPVVGEIGFFNGSTCVYESSGIPFNTGEWYKITLYSNFSESTWSAFEGINGENIICYDAGRMYEATNWRNIRLGKSDTTITYYDDVSVEVGGRGYDLGDIYAQNEQLIEENEMIGSVILFGIVVLLALLFLVFAVFEVGHEDYFDVLSAFVAPTILVLLGFACYTTEALQQFEFLGLLLIVVAVVIYVYGIIKIFDVAMDLGYGDKEWDRSPDYEYK